MTESSQHTFDIPQGTIIIGFCNVPASWTPSVSPTTYSSWWTTNPEYIQYHECSSFWYVSESKTIPELVKCDRGIWACWSPHYQTIPSLDVPILWKWMSARYLTSDQFLTSLPVCGHRGNVTSQALFKTYRLLWTPCSARLYSWNNVKETVGKTERPPDVFFSFLTNS